MPKEIRVNNQLNIYQKLLQVRKTVPYLQKATQGHQYVYVGSSQVLGAVREQLDKVGLMLFPKVIDSNVIVTPVENNDKFGNRKVSLKLLTELKMEFMWVDVDSGEQIVVPFYAQGIDTEGEKGVGKALTYAEKYFLLKQFNIATDTDDPDSFQNKMDATVPNFISREQVDELMNYASQVASMRNVPIDSIIQSLQLGIKSFERLYANKYKAVRGMLLDWIKAAESKQEQSPQQSNDKGSTNFIIHDTFTLKQYETGFNNQNAPYGKICALTANQEEVVILVKDNAQLIETIKDIQWGSLLTIAFYQENGFYFLEHIIDVQNAQPQNQQEFSHDSAERYLINQIERGNSPSGIPYTKMFVTKLSNNEQMMVFTPDEQAVQQTNHLVDGQEVAMAIRKENGFNFFVSLGGAK